MTAARIAVILAGGASTRMPGGKAGARLGGRTLLERAIGAAQQAGLEAVVSTRADVILPAAGVPVWPEPHPSGPPHPLHGIAAALDQAAEPIVVLPVDLPFLPPRVLSGLAGHGGDALLGSGGRPAALVARLDPGHAPTLREAAIGGAPAMRTLRALGATLVDLASLVPDAAPRALFNVNDPAALAEAERMLAG